MSNRGMRWGKCWKNKDLVFQMNQKQASLAEIARAVGTTGIRVHQFLRENGETRKFPTSWKGPRCSQWHGGRHIDRDGYVLVYCPEHPFARGSSESKIYVREHRLIMEMHLGRYLMPHEVVHHKNKVKTDNRIENLELFESNADHLSKELKGKCPAWTKDGMERIRQGILRSANRRRGKTRAQLIHDVAP